MQEHHVGEMLVVVVGYSYCLDFRQRLDYCGVRVLKILVRT